ncbi:50S ribosomal protein L23 [Lentisphaerota bacterium WC36G]|nr:50S ribosomal protein L23 [Lentisphaerae bacterium WC36]
MKNAYEVIDTVLITEKNAELAAEGKYVFKVHPKSNKVEIAKAVEKLFDGVKVKSVNVMNYTGKPKRAGRSLKMGKRADWKKAIVTLASGNIDVL